MRRHALAAVLLLLASPVRAEAPALTLERLFANPPLLGALPRALTVAPDGRHVAWLAPRADDQLRFDLWVRNLETGAERMAVDSLALSSGPVALSEAELMRRERARLASARGIVDYQWAPDGTSVLVPLDGDVWLAPLAGAPRRLTDTPATEIDAKLSPGGRFVSFVRDQNLYLIDLATGQERPLTSAGGGPVSYGVAEFVAQEEMDRTTGQWWAPDDRRIAVARIDESPVKVAVRAAIGSDGTRVTEQRYPFAGTPNVLVSLAIHSTDGSPPVAVDLGRETDIYLARVDWLGADRLVVQRQSRNQKRLDLLLVDAGTGASRILFSETSPTWINLHSSFRPLADGRRFLWASERSGFRHLYLWDGRALRQITRGRWDVDELLGVDEAGGQLLFTGWRDSPIEKALYRVALGGGEPVRLTPAGGWAEASADRRGTKALVSWTAPDQPTEAWLVQADGRRETIRANPLAQTPYAALAARHLPARHGTLKAADGRTDLNYMLFLPAGLKPGERVPVFFEVYAGPGVQRVRRQFGSLLHQYLVQQGWAVFMVDNRGTPARGRAFSDALYRRLGVTEVADQMAALDWVKRQPWADPGRVAVYGWSYGGYMVQRLMTEHPDAFAAGVSGAPVTDWTLYDTHYTERYLGNPALDRMPYDASDVTRRAGRLARPLLIIHGLADDNVVFDHSAKMMGALQQAGRPFETMVYPGQTHRIAEPVLQRHMWATILAFLDRTVRASSGSPGRSPDRP
ncbi:MAG: DPP IV N-terminal domain-containing protein [Sphingomonadaceae bacterium]